jgi:CBS domain containing-hemolysin-like protein
MWFFSYTVAVLLTSLGGLVLFAYLDRIYRELGRVTTGRVHANLDVFEAEIEPRLGMDRRRASLTFSLLAHGWLVLAAVATARGVTFFTWGTVEAVLQHIVYLGAQITVCMHLLPSILLARTTGRWLGPLLPVVRVFTWLVWPVRALLETAASFSHLAEEKPDPEQAQQEGLEALVEAAQEEGILEHEEARLIEQVVEFGDKRVREVMTPRPEVTAIPAGATIEQLRRLLVETKFSRIPVYDGTLDEIVGVVHARDIVQVPESEARTRTVRELYRPAMFVPETKLGSRLLKEMQAKRQQMAIVIDEHGLTAGLVTIEDLVEQIVGDISEEDRVPVPEVAREADGTLLLRGSVEVSKVAELCGVELDPPEAAEATTIGGLLNALAGHVPVPGEAIEHAGLRFEVLEANQRKVLRLRARRKSAPTVMPARAANP